MVLAPPVRSGPARLLREPLRERRNSYFGMLAAEKGFGPWHRQRQQGLLLASVLKGGADERLERHGLRSDQMRLNALRLAQGEAGQFLGHSFRGNGTNPPRRSQHEAAFGESVQNVVGELEPLR